MSFIIDNIEGIKTFTFGCAIFADDTLIKLFDWIETNQVTGICFQRAYENTCTADLVAELIKKS